MLPFFTQKNSTFVTSIFSGPDQKQDEKMIYFNHLQIKSST